MKLRAPSVPLITVDPYFSIWSGSDKLTDSDTVHWTGKPQKLTGTVLVDGKAFRFMGRGDAPALTQTGLEISACTSAYTFENESVCLSAAFTSPLLPNDLDIASRPVSFLELCATSKDGAPHDIGFVLTMDDSVCLNEKFQYPTETAPLALPALTGASVRSCVQNVLNRSGDDLRIDWGTAFLATNAPCAAANVLSSVGENGNAAHTLQLTVEGDTALIAFAYDDVRSIQYFGENLPSYWNRDGKTIFTALQEAFADYPDVKARCGLLAKDLRAKTDNDRYYELLSLAFRQSFAAHKLAVDENGEVLFISKECFSNGCAATVDVSYPSVPLYLLYNPELVLGMLRPIFRFAEGDGWPFSFAPHDAGQYPLVNGQVYSEGTNEENQMPVEECGNMLIMLAAAALASGDISFAKAHWTLLEQWVVYLLEYGLDPKNQLCTDDFAGHLAHNCNLALKAIMGVAAFGILLALGGDANKADAYFEKARAMAAAWLQNAHDDETVFRLAFDRPGTWSMKYNAVWDFVFETGIFPPDAFERELQTHLEKHLNRYGLPLDNRATYTKSDWLLWTAAMMKTPQDFSALVDTLWTAYHESESRVPLTDWYDTETGKKIGFQNRTVQGGLFMQVLKESGICRFRKEP